MTIFDLRVFETELIVGPSYYAATERVFRAQLRLLELDALRDARVDNEAVKQEDELQLSSIQVRKVRSTNRDACRGSVGVGASSAESMSFGRPQSFSDFTSTPPDRGSFPLDHDGAHFEVSLIAQD